MEGEVQLEGVVHEEDVFDQQGLDANIEYESSDDGDFNPSINSEDSV